jgi:hypothetical protein
MGFGSLKTAWYMGHRVRVTLMEDIGKLGGILEVDETFVGGGLAKNRHWDKRGGGGGTGSMGSGKTPIVGALSVVREIWRNPYSNHRRLLVDLQARRSRHVSQNEPQIYAALCC